MSAVNYLYFVLAAALFVFAVIEIANKKSYGRRVAGCTKESVTRFAKYESIIILVISVIYLILGLSYNSAVIDMPYLQNLWYFAIFAIFLDISLSDMMLVKEPQKPVLPANDGNDEEEPCCGGESEDKENRE